MHLTRILDLEVGHWGSGSTASLPSCSTRPRRAAPLDRERPISDGADPLLAQIIDARPTFDPREWMAELPAMALFGALLYAEGRRGCLVARRTVPYGMG